MLIVGFLKIESCIRKFEMLELLESVGLRKKTMFERKERKKVESSSQILGWGSAIVACIIGLRLLGILTLNTEVMTNAIVLLILGGVLLAEFYKERRDKMGLERSVSTGDRIIIVLASAAILLGVVELIGVWINLPTFPLPVYGAIGLLYIILAAVMIVKIYT